MEKVVLPDDIEIINFLIQSDNSLIFGGGFADHLHVNNYILNDQVFLNDLDIVVTNKFIDSMSDSFEHLDFLMKSKKFKLSPFSFDGTIADNPTKEIYFKNSKYGVYPTQMRMYVRSKMIDVFVCPFEIQDFIEIDLLGFKLKIQALKSRKKQIHSILDKNFMSYKKDIFQKKLDELNSIL